MRPLRAFRAIVSSSRIVAQDPNSASIPNECSLGKIKNHTNQEDKFFEADLLSQSPLNHVATKRVSLFISTEKQQLQFDQVETP